MNEISFESMHRMQLSNLIRCWQLYSVLAPSCQITYVKSSSKSNIHNCSLSLSLSRSRSLSLSLSLWPSPSPSPSPSPFLSPCPPLSPSLCLCLCLCLSLSLSVCRSICLSLSHAWNNINKSSFGMLLTTQNLRWTNLNNDISELYQLNIVKTPISQITPCNCPISHNKPFRTEMCTFLFWMVYCEIWDRCIMGFVNLF